MDTLDYSSAPAFMQIDSYPPSNGTQPRIEAETASDERGESAENPPDSNELGRLIIAVDFGTTFSSVAYARLPPGAAVTDLTPSDVRCISEYPEALGTDDAPETRKDVPTELWYNVGLQSSFVDNMEIDEENSDRESSTYTDVGGQFSSSDEDSDHERERQPYQTQPDDQPSTPRHQIWGFEVQKHLDDMDIPKDNARRVSRFKLLLDPNQHTEGVRRDLEPILKRLKSKRFKHIEKDNDIFAHYLTHLLTHAKDELEKSGELIEDLPIEFVLCVPAKWPSKGCRVMQTAMGIAVKEAGLGQRAIAGASQLFIISEPEAAAACVLAEDGNDIFPGETIVIVDAGGGTIDAVTYQVTNEEPLRLSAEVVAPDSQLNGSSYINERFAEVLMRKLKHEKYLEKNGKTIKSIVASKTVLFENTYKRKVDMTKDGAVIPAIFVDDLRQKAAKGLYANRILLNDVETKKIFNDSLRAAKAVLRSQLELAHKAGFAVHKVILTGGFGQSRGLRNYLRNYLKTQKNNVNNEIHFLVSKTPSTAVAQGAVLRAVNKELGPKRMSQCSYGCLRHEAYEPEIFPAHKATRPRFDKVDGEKYVHGTIYWMIHAGDLIPNREEYSIPQKHTFKLTDKELRCEEVLFVSDQTHESHYRESHAQNSGADIAGSIIANMTFLKDQGLIQPVQPSSLSRNFGSQKQFWVVEFDLVLIVEGRSLRYEARWPQKTVLQEGQKQETKVTGQICIAAAFEPGTA